MNERHWEIIGNLGDDTYGIKNYSNFCNVVFFIKSVFDELFGIEFMNLIDLFVDNATSDSGFTPSATPVLNKYVIIKLNISLESDPPQIAYQFAHELTHFVFYVNHGISKPLASDHEETFCSAASLIIIRNFFPLSFNHFNCHVKTLENIAYRKGANLASSLNYDLGNMKDYILKIHSFDN